MEVAHRANLRDFVGPFTTSCETQTKLVSKRRTNTVIGGSTWYCELANPIVSTRCITNPIQISTFLWCGPKPVLSLLCEINFICVIFFKISAPILTVFCTTWFLQETIRICQTHLWLNGPPSVRIRSNQFTCR